MKVLFTILTSFCLMLAPAYSQEDGSSYNDNCEVNYVEPIEPQGIFQSSSAPEDNDPLEPVNRYIFAFNDFLDTVLFDPISAVYTTILPEGLRIHIGYVLRNLSEPVVFANNILQGEPQDAEDTIRRFLINTTVGLGGFFDVSTSLDIPYKKEDFGLTLACWGVQPGPYIVIPILGPSNARDACGRIADFLGDPINWVAMFGESVFYSNTRTSAQIIDVKSDSEIIAELKKNIDPYATFRAWYTERRKFLANRDQILDSPRPD
ncbi:MAG TPA: VacJ family lipoprotein [Alphaproteobacteria bacterium]|nr:VacJ family lipoprotein [Alphaproteobacteria bacterium]